MLPKRNMYNCPKCNQPLKLAQNIVLSVAVIWKNLS